MQVNGKVFRNIPSVLQNSVKYNINATCYTTRGDGACGGFPWQDYNGKRQIKFGAKMRNLSHNGVTWGLFCLLIGLHLVCM